MTRTIPGVSAGLESRVDDQGFEVVEVQWAGSRNRPILRVRIDRPDAPSGGGVTVEDCACVSRALERWLDELEDVPERYVLEVSSPGVDRPLVRERDWTRFAGEKVAVKGRSPLAGRATRLEGVLLGLREQQDGPGWVRLRLPDGEEVEIPRDQIVGAHLLYEWR